MSRRNNLIRHQVSGRTRLLQIAGTLALVLTLVAVYIARDTGVSNEQGIDRPVGAGQVLQPEAGAPGFDGPTRDVTVYLDGWSLATLQGVEITASSATLSTRVRFSPVDADDIDDALRTDPGLVANVVARMLTPDRRVVCDTDGCRADGVIDLDVLTDGPTIPVFGPSYQAWGVNAGLYKAVLTIPADSDFVTFSAPGYSSHQASFGLISPESDMTGTDTSPAVSPTATTAPVTTDGDTTTGRVTTAYLGAAYGRLFPVLALWRDAATGGQATTMIRGGTDVAWEADRIASFAGALSAGPGAVGAAAAATTLNASQLTYLSSPTTGCGPVPVCTPQPLTIDRKATTKSYDVCSADGQNAVILVTSVTSVVPFSRATHVSGAWGATPVKDFPGASEMQSVVGYAGRPPLVSSTMTLYSIEVLLADNAGIHAVAGARDTKPLTGITLAPADLFNGEYKSC